MKISIITVTRNSAKTLEETLQSLYSQSLFQEGEVEHIIIDGASTDETLDILKRNSRNIAALVSEPDNGIYDAINKGIAIAQSNIVGILNSDDIYQDPDVLKNVVSIMNTRNIDLVYANLVYFNSNKPEKIVRRYQSKFFSVGKLSYGLIPAHPTVFVKRSVYERLGTFDPKFRIAGDFDWLARFFKSDSATSLYIPKILIRMRMGGKSTVGLKNLMIKNNEILHACTKNNIPTNYFKICLRFFIKARQFI